MQNAMRNLTCIVSLLWCDWFSHLYVPRKLTIYWRLGITCVQDLQIKPHVYGMLALYQPICTNGRLEYISRCIYNMSLATFQQCSRFRIRDWKTICYQIRPLVHIQSIFFVIGKVIDGFPSTRCKSYIIDPTKYFTEAKLEK